MEKTFQVWFATESSIFISIGVLFCGHFIEKLCLEKMYYISCLGGGKKKLPIEMAGQLV